MEKLHELTVFQASRLLNDKKISSVELTKSIFRRLHEVEPSVQAFVTITESDAMEQARRADEAINRRQHANLTGIPMAIKDNICTKNIPTTCSSRMLRNFKPPYNATVINKLTSAGAIMVGKTNMDEFAMGSSTENSAFFSTHNPWDLKRVPGGSSGGSAASVAAGQALFALGSDTGGSIRQPAGFCNVVGLKPTYGLVSRYGLVAFASSLDQIGPLTADVRDCALVLQTVAGHDPKDATSAPGPVPDYLASLQKDIKGLKLGVPKEYFVKGMAPEVEQVIQQSIEKFRQLGAEIEEASLPHTKYALAVYYIIAPSEASANLARYDGVKYGYSATGETMWESMERTKGEGFGPEVKRRIMLGTYALSAGYYDAYYLKAQKVRTKIKLDFDKAFEKFDALITPTSPTVPFLLGERTSDPVQMYLSDVCTLPVNIAGIPGISIPAGFIEKKGQEPLPIGLQLLGPPFSEETLLRLGYAYQEATDWHIKKPTL